MTILYIVTGILLLIFLFIIWHIITYTDDLNITKFIYICLCVLGVATITLTMGLEYGEKRGHIKMYQGNPKYEMDILYNKHQEPVDTIYVNQRR